jgi:hypothetical protein
MKPEAKNDSAGEGQQQSNRPTALSSLEGEDTPGAMGDARGSPASEDRSR